MLIAEFRYLLYTRRLVVVLAVLAAGVAVAASGSLSAARSAHAQFVRSVAFFEKSGISLQEALAAPVNITRNGNAESIDNPLKYDYLQVGQSVAALSGAGMVGTALDLVTFIVVPLMFILLGANLATYDRRSGTLAFRASRERWARVVAGKMVALVVL